MIIGISGKQRVGKDTLAVFLKSALASYGYCFNIKSLSHPIKIAYAQSQGITLAELEATKSEHREALQRIGDGARQSDPDIWIERLSKSCNPQENIIIADIRYKNEYAWIRNKGGILIRVESDRELRNQRGKLENEGHISEIDLDGLKAGAWDRIFYNNAAQEALADKAANYVNSLAPRLCEFIL